MRRNIAGQIAAHQSWQNTKKYKKLCGVNLRIVYLIKKRNNHLENLLKDNMLQLFMNDEIHNTCSKMS